MYTAQARGSLTNRCRRDDGVILWLQAPDSDGALDDAQAYVVPFAGEGADPDLAERAMVLPLFRTHAVSYTVLRGVRVITAIGTGERGSDLDRPRRRDTKDASSRRTS